MTKRINDNESAQLKYLKVVYRNFGAEGLRSFADAVRSAGTEAISIRQGVELALGMLDGSARAALASDFERSGLMGEDDE